jgi:two-component system phosphate regulon sensor histidine kinase PhoR
MALFRRRELPAAIEALQAELAGGPPAELSPELDLLQDLFHSRQERARVKEGPERELLAALPDAAAVVGREGLVRIANAALEALAPGGRAAGLSTLELTRAADLAEAVKRGLEGTARKLEVELPGRRRVFLAHVEPLLRGDVLLLLREITEAKRAESIRRDFVANASHELRTPVATIRGAAETLLDGALGDPESARHFVDVIARHADRLAHLTQDLLDLSRIELGHWTMSLERVDLGPLVGGVLDLHQDPAEQKAIALASQVPEGLAIRADARALEQVLVNLVDNAVKYTPDRGRVTVVATVDGPRRLASISVDDTGPGIERHHLPRLFERFYRVDPGRSREQGGTGLGLAIAKHLIQAQGGDIGVESGAGGTRFWVRLPLE